MPSGVAGRIRDRSQEVPGAGCRPVAGNALTSRVSLLSQVSLQNICAGWRRGPDGRERDSKHQWQPALELPDSDTRLQSGPVLPPPQRSGSSQEASPRPPQPCSSRRQTASGYSFWIFPGCQVSHCRTAGLSHSYRDIGPEPPNPRPRSSCWQVSPGRR